VLVVLALACVPALAQAEEATGPVYDPEVPTVPSENGSGGGDNQNVPGGGGEAEKSGVPGTGSGDAGGKGDGADTGQGNQGPGAQSGKPGAGPDAAEAGLDGSEPVAALGPDGTQASDEGSSSPLVPILIAIAVLAAISVGAFFYRQRRQGAGSPISPKAS
jgi:hypothetical protein